MDWTGNVSSWFFPIKHYLIDVLENPHQNFRCKLSLETLSYFFICEQSESMFFLVSTHDYIVVMIPCSFLSFLRSALGRPPISRFYNTMKFLSYSYNSYSYFCYNSCFYE